MVTQRLDSFERALDSSSFEETLEKADDLRDEDRLYLAKRCDQCTVEDLIGDTTLRVRVVRCQIALLPDSFAVIEDWLSDPRLYEIHFTLFCYLNWVAEWQTFFPLKQKTLDLTTAFLLNVRRDSGSAAWMAGDLLGDHWPPNESAPVLAYVLGKAKYAAGRRGALHGVEMLLARDALTQQNRKSVLRALKASAENDRSAIVRESAARLLKTARRDVKKVVNAVG